MILSSILLFSLAASLGLFLVVLIKGDGGIYRQLLLGNCVLDNCSCIVLLPAIHGSMRYPNTVHPWTYALLSVSVPDSTLPIPSLESYYLRPYRQILINYITWLNNNTSVTFDS